MAACLLRIDDRLLHGQVLVAWAQALRPQRILLASDEIAAYPVRSAVYAGLPQEDYELAVETLAEAAHELRAASAGGGKGLLVVCASPAEAHRLLELGAPVRHVNVGGMHHAEGKRQLLGYVFLSRQDAEELRALLQLGVEVEARDLPGSRGARIDAAALENLWA